MGFLVLVRGVLTGTGGQVECELIARKVLATGVADPVYSDCSIVNAPHDLPDGEYIAYFEGHSIPATREHGMWLSRGTAKRES